MSLRETTPGVRRWTPGLLLVLLAACATTTSLTADEFENHCREIAVTDLKTDRFELTSPYDAAATDEFARVVGEELGRVEEVLDAASGPPVRVHLVPLDPGAADVHDRDFSALFPSHDGIGGMQHGGFLFVYVAARGTGPTAFVHAEMLRDTIRHELTHAIALRAGLARATWFDEGLARCVEDMTVDGGRLRERPFPSAIFVARDTARRGTIADLLRWSLRDQQSRETRALRYEQSEALVRFLAERTPGGDWGDRVRRVHALPNDAVLATEPDWLAWLASQDALAAVRAGLARPDPDERARAAALLPVLAGVARELQSRAADEVALGLLRDPRTRASAETFLVFYRAKDLTPADLAALRADGDPSVVLVGEGLRAQRGEPFDAARAQEIWNALDAKQRIDVGSAAHFLGLKPTAGE
jgi:hypothetical protein